MNLLKGLWPWSKKREAPQAPLIEAICHVVPSETAFNSIGRTMPGWAIDAAPISIPRQQLLGMCGDDRRPVSHHVASTILKRGKPHYTKGRSGHWWRIVGTP